MNIQVGNPKQTTKVEITVDGEDFGEAYQVNGQWWLVFAQGLEESLDLTYIGTANTEHEIMGVVANYIEEQGL
jgi:hypothetical protein